MQFSRTSLPDLVLVTPEVFGDERGFFMETWQRRKFAEAGIDAEFVQDNHSRSVRGTLRGLHYQVRRPQGKLVRVSAGEIFDVAVDIRPDSATFGRWTASVLSADNRRMLWMPPGFAHGFYILSDSADVQYKCTDYYFPELDRTIRWDDPDLAIEWPLLGEGPPILSAKDRAGRPFADLVRDPQS